MRMARAICRFGINMNNISEKNTKDRDTNIHPPRRHHHRHIMLRTRAHWSGSTVHNLDHWTTTAWRCGAVVVTGSRSTV
jgi:hypothetical protein